MKEIALAILGGGLVLALIGIVICAIIVVIINIRRK